MKRYEVVITVLLDAEDENDAANIAESLVVTDPSVDENEIDYIVSNAIEVGE